MKTHESRVMNRILSRRQTLVVFRSGGAALLALALPRQLFRNSAQATPPSAGRSIAASATCVVRPEQTEGPYFVDERLNRSDIRSDPSDSSVREGVPLQLTVRVSRLSEQECVPLAGATVDVWHCDALGTYSDVSDRNFNTVGKKFLRGYQTTDTNGVVQFTTIYPGWYPGRTVHIHFKVRAQAATGQNYEFTSQLYFDDAVTDQVHRQLPYAQHGQPNQTNAQDGIFGRDGKQLLLTLVPQGAGYAATFDLGIRMAAA